MKPLFFLFLFLLYPGTVFSQSLIEEFQDAHSRFFHLYSSERTDLNLGYRYEFGANEESGPGSFDMHSGFMDFLLVVPEDRDVFISIGGDFEVRRYMFDEVAGARTSTGAKNLYKLSISPGAGVFLSDSVLAWTSLTVGNFSDLERGFSSIEDYQLLGDARLIFQINPGAQLLFGLSYTNTYLDQRLMPFLGLRLLSETGKVHISIDFPFHGRIGYYFTPHWEAFTQFVVEGDRYNATINQQEFEIGLHDQRWSVGLRTWLGTYFSLTMEGGRTVGNELRFAIDQPGQFADKGEIEPHFFLRTYLGIAF